MKACLIVLAALAMIAGTRAHAGPPDPRHHPCFAAPSDRNTRNLDGVMKSYTRTLQEENDGVVESALAQVAYLGVSLPGGRFDEVKKAVVELTESGRTPMVRYKAYLASIALDSPELFVHQRGMEFDNGEELFTAISMTLHKTLLGYGQ